MSSPFKKVEEGDRAYKERVRAREAAKKKAKDAETARKKATTSKAKAALKSDKSMNAYQRFGAERGHRSKRPQHVARRKETGSPLLPIGSIM